MSLLVAERDLLARVAQYSGLETERELRRAVRATIHALSQALDPGELARLCAALPPKVVPTTQATGASVFEVERFYSAVRRRERTTPGFAREHAQSVCHALAELLPEELVARLRGLGGGAGGLFPERRATLSSEPPPYRAAEGPSARRVSVARPGSRHPIATSRALDAHAESVARSLDPHGDTKLSGAHGLTQERVNESLATFRKD